MPIENLWDQDRLYPLVPDCREEKVLALSQKVRLLWLSTFKLLNQVYLQVIWVIPKKTINIFVCFYTLIKCVAGKESRRDPLLRSCPGISPQRRLQEDDDAPHDQVVMMIIMMSLIFMWWSWWSFAILVTNHNEHDKVRINWKIISKCHLQCSERK